MKYTLTILLLAISGTILAQPGSTVPKNPAPAPKSNTNTKPKPAITPAENYPAGTIILEVDFEMIGCESDKSKTCLLIRQKGKGDFEIYDQAIKGFNYEPGNTYTIAVTDDGLGGYQLHKVISKKFVKYSNNAYNPPGNDQAATSYTPVSKEKEIPKSNVYTSPLDKKWYLRTLLEKEGTFIVSENNNYWIEFNSFMDRFKGNSFCNSFEGIFKSDLTTLLKVDQLNMGKEKCYQSRLEDILYTNLLETDRFEIRGTTLYLSKQWKILMTFDLGYDSSPFTSKQEANTSTKVSEKTNNIQPVQQEIKPATIESNTTDNANEEKPAIAENTPINSGTANNAELEAMKKQIEELKKQLEAKNAGEKNTNKPNELSASNTTTLSIENNSTPLKSSGNNQLNTIYCKTGENMVSLEKIITTPYIGQNIQYLSATTPKSGLRFKINNIPKLFIEIKDPKGDPIDLYVLSFIKPGQNTRNFIYNDSNINTVNSIINFGYKSINPSVYEIAFPFKLEPGEYAFIYLPGIRTNTNTQEIYTFAIEP